MFLSFTNFLSVLCLTHINILSINEQCNIFYHQACDMTSYQLRSSTHTQTHTSLSNSLGWVVGAWDGPLAVTDGGIHCRLCHSYLTALSGSVSSITVTSVWHAKYMMSATAQEICLLNEDGCVSVCIYCMFQRCSLRSLSNGVSHCARLCWREDMCFSMWMLVCWVCRLRSSHYRVSYWRNKLSVAHLTPSWDADRGSIN